MKDNDQAADNSLFCFKHSLSHKDDVSNLIALLSAHTLIEGALLSVHTPIEGGWQRLS